MVNTPTETDSEQLPTAFARHKLTHGVPFLWDERRIAIHWESLPSTTEGDYEEQRARTEIKNLNQIAKNGAIVGASYREYHKNKMLVGIAEPNSKIDLLLFDYEDRTLVEKIPIEPDSRTEVSVNENIVIYKSVELEDSKVVTREELPVLFDDGIRPPFWSVCGWENMEDQLRAIIEGDLPPYEVGSLTTTQLEIVCEEYLRIVDDKYHRTAEIGGNIADVDIMGASEGELVWAQVTQQSNPSKISEKVEKVEDYKDEKARVIIFGPEGSRPSDLNEDITYIPVEAVFETVNLNPRGSTLLSRLLGRLD